VLNRNRAIVAALLARVAKFMTAVLRLSSDGGFGEVALALNRSILESRTDIVYLCHDNSLERFERYVKDGLAAERALYDRVVANVKKRGYSLPIEDRLLEGVSEIFRISGVRIEDVEPGRRSLDLASRLREIGREDEYLFVQKIPSVTVHGTWLDLLHHHLSEVEGGFRVRFEQTAADVRGLIPTGLLVLDALTAFCKRHLSAAPEIGLLEERIEDLGRRMRKVDESHEKWFQGRKASAGDDPHPSPSDEGGAPSDTPT